MSEVNYRDLGRSPTLDVKYSNNISSSLAPEVRVTISPSRNATGEGRTIFGSTDGFYTANIASKTVDATGPGAHSVNSYITASDSPSRQFRSTADRRVSPVRISATISTPTDVKNTTISASSPNTTANISSTHANGTRISIDSLRASVPATIRSPMDISIDDSVGHRARVAALATEVSDLMRRQAQLANRLQAKEKEADELKNHVAKTRETAAQREKMLRDELSTVGVEVAKLRTNNARLTADIQPLQSEVDRLRGKVAAGEESLRMLDDQKRELTAAYELKRSELLQKVSSVEDELEKERLRSKQALALAYDELAREREALGRKEAVLMAELQAVEQHVASLQDTFDAKTRQLEAQRDALLDEAATLRARLGSREEELRKQSTALQASETQFREVQRKLAEREAEFAAKENGLSDRVVTLTRELERAHEDIGGERARRSQLEGNLADVRGSLEACESELKKTQSQAGTERTRLSEELRAIKDAKGQVDAQLALLTTQFHQTETQLIRITALEEQAQEQLSVERQLRRSAEVHLDSEQERSHVLETKLQRSQETEYRLVEELDVERSSRKKADMLLEQEQRKTAQLDESLTLESQARANAQSQLRQTIDDLTTAQRRESELERDLRLAREEAARAQAQLVHTRAALDETEHAYRQERTRAEEAHLKSVEFERDVEQLADKLRNAQASFDAATIATQTENRRLTETLSRIQRENEELREKQRVQAETLRVTSLKASELEGVAHEGASLSERLKDELDVCRTTLERKNAEVSQLVTELSSERQERQTASLEQRRLKGQLEVTESELRVTQESLKHAKRSLTKLTDTYGELEQHAKRLEADAHTYERAELELRQMREELTAAQRVLMAREDDLLDSDAHVRDMRKMLDALKSDELLHPAQAASQVNVQVSLPSPVRPSSSSYRAMASPSSALAGHLSSATQQLLMESASRQQQHFSTINSLPSAHQPEASPRTLEAKAAASQRSPRSPLRVQTVQSAQHMSPRSPMVNLEIEY